MMRYGVVEWSLTRKAHELIAEVVGLGDAVVDATMGNGHDTLFLARCVGTDGKVIGFDVQQKALDETRRRLLSEGIADSNVELHHESHDQLSNHVIPDSIAAVVFNLGYLPGADKALITQVNTTLNALTQSVSCLRKGGVLSVMCYPGHSGGDKEASAVKQWMNQCEGSSLDICCYRRREAKSNTPFLFSALKKGLS
jgi:16S rRNA C1402 N4-methylase RsmH